MRYFIIINDANSWGHPFDDYGWAGVGSVVQTNQEPNAEYIGYYVRPVCNPHLDEIFMPVARLEELYVDE